MVRAGGNILRAYVLARNGGKEAAHYGHKTYAAAVHNAGFFEHGQKLGSMREGLVAHGNERGEECDEILIFACQFGRGLAHHSYYG